MLINITGDRDCVSTIPGKAHIVISLDITGRASMQAFIEGSRDSSYMHLDDARLINRDLPKLLGELRQQIQSLSGSTVTE